MCACESASASSSSSGAASDSSEVRGDAGAEAHSERWTRCSLSAGEAGGDEGAGGRPGAAAGGEQEREPSERPTQPNMWGRLRLQCRCKVLL